jgi:hypothetical protein
MWGAAFISAVLGTRLPGAGTAYEHQTLNFLVPIRAGDTRHRSQPRRPHQRTGRDGRRTPQAVALSTSPPTSWPFLQPTFAAG